jgi:ABC-type polysaccharide/polyol phosphate export permease
MVFIWGIGLFMAALQGAGRGALVAHVGIGFIMFRLCTGVVAESPAVFAAYRTFIYDGRNRLTDYVLRAIARAFIYLVFAVPLMFLALYGAPEANYGALGMTLVGLLLVIVNLIWVGLLLGLVGARFPDLHELIASIMIALFLVTPIVWQSTSAPIGTLHGNLMRMNPLAHWIMVIRDPLLSIPVEPLSWWVTLLGIPVGGLVAALAYQRYAPRVPIWL